MEVQKKSIYSNRLRKAKKKKGKIHFPIAQKTLKVRITTDAVSQQHSPACQLTTPNRNEN